MSTCTKSFSIVISDVATFIWQVPLIVLGDGAASFSPDNAPGNTALCTASTPAAAALGSQAQNSGFIDVWNSTVVVPCNMHINIATVGVNPDPLLQWDVQMWVTFPFLSLVFENQGTLGFNGSFDVPFNLPNTGGSDWQIHWLQDCTVLSNPANAGAIVVEGIFTVI